MEIDKEQQNICKKYGANFLKCEAFAKVGISLNVKNGVLPINGMRHPIESDTSGWYIWAGDYSDDPDFFQPLHIEHINEWSPLIEKYLGLEPGWRFLITENYEDVWRDTSLLDIK